MENLELIFDEIRKDYLAGTGISQERFDEIKKIFDEKDKTEEKKDDVSMLTDFFSEDLELEFNDEKSKIKKYFNIDDNEMSDLKDKAKMFLLPYDKMSYDDNKKVAVYAVLTNDLHGYYCSLLSCKLIMFSKYVKEQDNENMIDAMMSLNSVVNACRNNGVDDSTIDGFYKFYLNGNTNTTDNDKLKDDVKLDEKNSIDKGNDDINFDNSLDYIIDRINDSEDDIKVVNDSKNEDEVIKESAPFKKPIKVKVVKTVVKKKSKDVQKNVKNEEKKDIIDDLVDAPSLKIPSFDLDLDKNFDEALNEVLAESKNSDRRNSENDLSKNNASKKSDFVVKIDNYFEDVTDKNNSKNNDNEDNNSKIEWSGSLWKSDDINLNTDKNVNTTYEYLNDGRTADDLVNQCKNIGNTFEEIDEIKNKKSIFRKVKRKTSHEEHESIKKKIIDKCIKILGLEEEYVQKRSK